MPIRDQQLGADLEPLTRVAAEAPAPAAQVPDHPALLRAMLEGLRAAPPEFHPTNYWNHYEPRFLKELDRFGLTDFRRRRRSVDLRHASVLSSFGATDLKPEYGRIDVTLSRLFANRLTLSIPGWPRCCRLANRFLNRLFPVTRNFYGADPDSFALRMVELAELDGQARGARSLREIAASQAGNPEDVVLWEGNPYTMSFLYYFLRYVYVQEFVPFEGISTIVELGSGSGKQVEVLKKLYPHLTFLLFDIPPQLYVCEQYLTAVFPGQVVSYLENSKGPRGVQEGKIHFFGSWQFPLVESVGADLFWNASSFQEMEPEVVLNYLRFVNRSFDLAYLQEMMEGQRVAPKTGQLGVMKRTTLETYRSGLEDFDLEDLRPSVTPVGAMPGYSDSFWRRRESEEGPAGQRGLATEPSRHEHRRARLPRRPAPPGEAGSPPPRRI